MIRISSDRSIPVHFEAVPLRGRVRACGWAVGLLTLTAGLTLAAASHGWVAELVAPFSVVAGGLLLFLVVRCRRWETTVGSTRIDLVSGPFKRTVPSGAVESTAHRRATSWRRLYSDQELVLTTSVGPGEVVVPSRNTEELKEAVTGVAS